MARPNKFDETFRTAYLAAISGGNSRVNAAKLAKRKPKTVEAWITAGNAGDPRYTEFVDEIEHAEAVAVDEAVGQVRSAGFENWKAAQAFLIAKAPEDWGDKARRSAKQAIEEILRVVEEELGQKAAARVMERLAANSSEEKGESATGAAESEPVH